MRNEQEKYIERLKRDLGRVIVERDEEHLKLSIVVKENTHLRQVLEGIRDLARTSHPPDALNVSNLDEWRQEKIYRIAREADNALKGGE